MKPLQALAAAMQTWCHGAVCLKLLPLLYVQVRETQATVRDGRTGYESMTIQRGIGDRVSFVSFCALLPPYFACTEICPHV
jgi:hypothetical protein